ncbi:N-acyl homoserine lactonase family protein [Rhizobium sp. Root1203]|uniref:N-acyl homoserine lactonase family protein n=1 Tax=Rhizobium sp. Root1203 TaxID=1736427 RepID=UPI000B16904D|nr:N-acyl homoserine lactonase family protein [Rhizobium sp. Root1203]
MEPFELFAIRYASKPMMTFAQTSIGGDLHEDHTPIDYFIWVAKRSDRVFLIDTGMGAETAKRRGESYHRVPAEAIRLLDLDPGKLEDIILTHIHYDHAGMLHLYPKANFHVQDAEMSYATGRCMCSPILRRGYEVEDVLHLVRCVYCDRVEFHSETSEITSGITLHRVSGHTAGQQAVRVWTKRGWVVIASDASHLYYNMETRAPFPSVYRTDEMMESFRTLFKLGEGSWDRVIPGHDPLVMARYPAPSPELEGIVVRLDVEPRQV